MPVINKKVVVRTRIIFEEQDAGTVVAAHLDAVGMTAYGSTVAKAEENVKNLLKQWIIECRALGILEARLDAMGADWSYIDEYKGPEPVEHLANNPGPPKNQVVVAPRHRGNNKSLAMAA